MWPFDIARKKRERLEAHRLAKEQEMECLRQSMRESAQRRAAAQSKLIQQSIEYRMQASTLGLQKPSPVNRAAPSNSSKPSSIYDDSTSPLNPLSPLYQSSHHLSSQTYSEPSYSSSHCGSSSSHSHSSSDHSSSYSHSSHDHGCSSSSYDSGSSSSSGGDW